MKEKKKRIYKKKFKPPLDKDGWVNALEHKPVDFDIVFIKDDNGRWQRGWWTGCAWEWGIRKINGNVVKWKETREHVITGV